MKRVLWSFTLIILPLCLSSQIVVENTRELSSEDFTQSNCCVPILTKNSSENRITDYSLSANYPNPFNPKTIIQYQLPRTIQVTLTVFNVLGQKIHTLVNTLQTKGFYAIQFNAEDLPAGIYFYRIQTDDFVKTRKMTLLP